MSLDIKKHFAVDDIRLTYPFEPSLNIFKNALVFNYKKVGSRFMQHVAEYPDSELDRKQLDLIFTSHQFNESLGTKNLIQFPIRNLYVKTVFDKFELNEWVPEIGNGKTLVDLYQSFKSQEELLSSENVNSWWELIFENPHKDIYFVIRNPIERFFSGLSQIVASLRTGLIEDEKEYKILKKFIDISDSDIKLFTKNYHLKKIYNKNEEGAHILEIWKKLVLYILNYRWDLIIEDIHTDNYLRNFHDFIQNVKDSSRVKVIELNQLSGQSGLDLLCNLRGDDLLRDNWDSVYENRESNLYIYEDLLDDIFMKDIENSILGRYIMAEYVLFLELKMSKYFYKSNEDFSNR